MSDPQPPAERALDERVEVVPYDPVWPGQFVAERERLRAWFPEMLGGRIEHFGSTAIPGMPAKPIVDMLVEVPSLDLVQTVLAPALSARGYEYMWRPSWQDPNRPEYAWFIRRGTDGARTHHLHMLEPESPDWQRLRFRDLLIARPDIAKAYGALKQDLASRFPNDRKAYSNGKTDFINDVMTSNPIRPELGKPDH